MPAKLHINLAQGVVDVEGEPSFVQRVYEDVKDQLIAHLARTPESQDGDVPPSTNATGKAHSSQKKTRSKKSGPSCRERIAAIQGEDFFKELRSSGEVRDKLIEKGTTYAANQVAAALTNMTKSGTLRRVKEGGGWKYQNP